MFSRDDLPREAIPLPDRFGYSDAEMIARTAAFFDHMRRRHSVRAFSPRPVPRAVIENAVATAGRAPSGANHQPWFFAAISNPALKAQIRAGAEEEEKRFYDGAAGDDAHPELPEVVGLVRLAGGADHGGPGVVQLAAELQAQAAIGSGHHHRHAVPAGLLGERRRDRDQGERQQEGEIYPSGHVGSLSVRGFQHERSNGSGPQPKRRRRSHPRLPGSPRGPGAR